MPHVIELVLMGPQTHLDITQALSEGELRKCHTKKLVETSERLNVTIAVVALDASAERFHRKMFHHLRKYQPTRVHDHPL